MSAQYEILPPGGHETMLEAVFNKVKSKIPNDENVKQKNYSTYNEYYRILFSGSADDTEHTEEVGKSTYLRYNPWAGRLELGGDSIFGVHSSNSTGTHLEIYNYDISLLNNTWDGTHTSLKDTITYLNSQSAANKVDKAGDTMTGTLQLGNGTAATDFIFKATSANDCGDIIWNYNNGKEMMRIWAPNGFTAYARPNWRCYKSDGTLVYSGGLLTTNDYAEAATGSKLVIRHSAGYVYATYFNQSSAVDNTNMSTGSYMMFCNSDGFLRKTSRLNFAKNLTNDNIGTGSQYFVTLTQSWGRFGYASATDARTAMKAFPTTGGTISGNVSVTGDLATSGKLRSILFTRADTGDSGYMNFVNFGNTAYAPVRSSGFVTMSCKHVKTNIEDISDEDAKKLLDLRPVNFDYVEEVGGDTNQVGVLAEDTYEILPKVVSVPDDYVEEDFDITKGIQQPLPSVDYAKFTPYLIKMVQIQQREIDELKTSLRALV